MKCEACEATAAEVLVDSRRRAPEFSHLCFDCGRQIRKESPHMTLQPDVAATERAILSVLLIGPRNAMDLKIATDHTSPRDVKRLDNRLQALKRGGHVTLEGLRWTITDAGKSYATVLGVDVKPERAKPEPKQQAPKPQAPKLPPPQLEEPAPIPAPAPAAHEAMPVVPETPAIGDVGARNAELSDSNTDVADKLAYAAGEITRLRAELADHNETQRLLARSNTEIDAVRATNKALEQELAELRRSAHTTAETSPAAQAIRRLRDYFRGAGLIELANDPEFVESALELVDAREEQTARANDAVCLSLQQERNAALDRADQLARELADIDAAMGLKAPRHVDERLDQVRSLVAERNTLLDAASARVEDRRTIDALLGELAECWSGPLAPDQAAPDSETVLRWAIREIDAARALREREAELEQHVNHLDAMVVRMQGRHRTPEFWADVASEVAGWGSWHANALMPGTTAAVFKTVATLLEVDALAQADLRRARAMQEAA